MIEFLEEYVFFLDFFFFPLKLSTFFFFHFYCSIVALQYCVSLYCTRESIIYTYIFLNLK